MTGAMKFFLDTANLDEIRKGASFGILDGVTTNPTLAAKEKRPFRDLILEICGIVKDGVVNAEVVASDYEGMLREAREVVSWHPNVVAKIPMTPEGVRALSKLSREGVRVNITLVFSPAQALIVAKAGAYFVSPFLGRLDDTSQDGLAVLREIMEIYRAYNFKTQVLAAEPAPSSARRGSSQNGRAHRYHALQGLRNAVQASSHRPRPGDVRERLAKSSRHSGRNRGTGRGAQRSALTTVMASWRNTLPLAGLGVLAVTALYYFCVLAARIPQPLNASAALT